jgi:hypothetical protein
MVATPVEAGARAASTVYVDDRGVLLWSPKSFEGHLAVPCRGRAASTRFESSRSGWAFR